MHGIRKGGRTMAVSVGVLVGLMLALGLAGAAQAETPQADTVKLNVDMSAQRE